MDPFDALSVCAEVGIAILGFSGIVVVFGGRSRGRVGEPMFRTLFRGTLIPLAVIAVAFVLDAASLERSTVWRICSAVQGLAVAGVLFVALRDVRSGLQTAPPWLPAVGGSLTLVLCALNVVSLHAFWPVIATVCWALGVGLWAFTSLIFRTAAD